jgi:predicted Zn-dependent peptidase
MVFAAAGKLDHDSMAAAVEARMTRSGGVRPQRSAPEYRGWQKVLFGGDTDQVHMMIGLPAVNRHHPDRYAMTLLDQILGGGMSSRLFQEVREKHGLAYTVYSSFNAYEDCGEMSMYAGTAPKRAQQALDIMCTEAQRLIDQSITPAELERAKRSIRATNLMNLEDVTARMSRIGRSLLLHGDVLSVADVQARLEAVTESDVRRVASDVFSVKPVMVALGPIEGLEVEWQ